MFKSFLTFLFISVSTSASAGAVEGIANIGPTDERVVMSRAEVASMFMTNRVYWPNGVRVTVYLLPKDSRAAQTFFFRIGLPIGAYFDSVNNMYSSGKLNVPIIVESDLSMVVRVNSTIGAIGYVGNVDFATSLPNIKVIEIEGEK